ncbi:sensor histidine kinase [Actinoplanes sp. GCM10030250]|uniref:sensor histidine kinase n=1 Tax=Actinoplanes sp. GCM10030250 TaxID=3273376 RepID=UPI003612FEC7
MTKNFILLGATLTLAGVLAGLALTGGIGDPVLAWSLAVALAGFVLATRRWPLTSLILMLMTVAAWRSSHLIDSGWVWPATAAFVAAALHDRLRAATVAGVIALAYGLVWDGVVDLRPADHVFAHIGGEALWLSAVLAGAAAYQNSLRWRAEVAHRIAQTERQQEIDARRRRAEERVEIARDLHDVVSHTLAVVGVHLNVAMDSFDAEPDEAKESLKLAQEVRAKAMTDLRALVGVLREGEVPALESLEGLIGQVREAGLPVSLNEFGDPIEVPAPVATAVYRVVQESLTNTVRHAGASRAIVTLRYAADGVLVDVQDDGRGADTIVDGHGIAGMRERVAALGGALTAGPGKSGFTVRASIPILAE